MPFIPSGRPFIARWHQGAPRCTHVVPVYRYTALQKMRKLANVRLQARDKGYAGCPPFTGQAGIAGKERIMLQDIGEGRLDNQYHEKRPQPNDPVLVFDGHDVLCGVSDDCTVALPRFGEVGTPDATPVPSCRPLGDSYLFLFRIDQTDYFLYMPRSDDDPVTEFGSYRYVPMGDARWPQPADVRYAIQVAYQLFEWYGANRFCGRCGAPTRPDRVERMLQCDTCGNAIYLRINPCIIVGIVDGDRLLLTRYINAQPEAWALVAGFTEIGETLEGTVEREVMEEVGLRVKSITYHTCQPWPRSSSLLMGFFAELDGSPEITLDSSELDTACWALPGEVPCEPDAYSMTREMMAFFVENHDHPERMIGLPPQTSM